MALLNERAPVAGVNVTPEMALLAVRCFAALPAPTAEHASAALAAIAAAETTNRHSDPCAATFHALFRLLARLGAMARQRSG